MYVCKLQYTYIRAYTHTHTHTHTYIIKQYNYPLLLHVRYLIYVRALLYIYLLIINILFSGIINSEINKRINTSSFTITSLRPLQEEVEPWPYQGHAYIQQVKLRRLELRGEQGQEQQLNPN